ncbi:hypothetical protein RFI_02026, partial [Reticulomyxa filosa]
TSGWCYSYYQSKWNYGNEDIAYTCSNNNTLQHLKDENSYKCHCTVLHKAARSGIEIVELIMNHKNDKNNKEYLDAMNICKWILKQRAIYLMKRIEYAMDYVKDKLVNEIVLSNSLMKML